MSVRPFVLNAGGRQFSHSYIFKEGCTGCGASRSENMFYQGALYFNDIIFMKHACKCTFIYACKESVVLKVKGIQQHYVLYVF